MRQAGLDWRKYRQAPLRRRLAAALRSLQVATPDAARSFLEANPAKIPAALSVILLGVTELFRDQAVFEFLDEGPLDQLLAMRRRLRVWSAGCSDGAELYSLAILLAKRGALEQSYCLGTDCRRDAIERAKVGIYPKRSDAPRLARFARGYLDPLGSCWQVNGSIRGPVQWQAADILELREREQWDVILCRNVSIYLEPSVAQDLLRRLEVALRPGGILVLGQSERPGRGSRLAPLGSCIFQRARVDA